MELCRDSKFDTGVNRRLKISHRATYRQENKVPDKASHFPNFHFGSRYHDNDANNDATAITRDAKTFWKPKRIGEKIFATKNSRLA